MSVKTISPAVLAMQDMALFVAVARVLSFTRASEASGIPIASLSRRISTLEQRVGVRLFERTTRHLTLTEPGKRYLERCEHIVQEADIAHEVLMDAVKRPAGHLRISMPVEFGLGYVSPIIDEFARHYPDITMDLDLSPRKANFADENIDVSIRLGEISDNLVARRLGSAERLLYASPAYLARFGTPRLPEDLSKHDCILQTYMAQPDVWQMISLERSVEIKVHGRFSTNNVSMTLKLAEQGYGIAVLSPIVARPAFDAGTIRRVLDDWSHPPISVYVLMSSRLVPARVRTFVDFLVSRLTM